MIYDRLLNRTETRQETGVKLTSNSCMIKDWNRSFNSRLPVIFHRQSPVLWWGHVALPKGLFASIQRRLLLLHIYLWRPPRLVSLLHTGHPIPAAVRYCKSKSCCFNFFLFFLTKLSFYNHWRLESHCILYLRCRSSGSCSKVSIYCSKYRAATAASISPFFLSLVYSFFIHSFIHSCFPL